MTSSTRALLGREATMSLPEAVEKSAAYILNMPSRKNSLKGLAQELANAKGFYAEERVQETIEEIANELKVSYKRVQKWLDFQSAADYFRTHNIAQEAVKDLEEHGGFVDTIRGRMYVLPMKKRHIHQYFHK